LVLDGVGLPDSFEQRIIDGDEIDAFTFGAAGLRTEGFFRLGKNSLALLKFTAKGAPGSGSFINDDFAQPGQILLKFAPKPSRHHFDRWAFQSFNIVQVAVIHAVDQRFHGIRDAFVVVNPADLRVHLALDMNLHLKAMAVHLPAFMVSGEARQSVGCFKAKVLDDSCAHDS
jgi:hypothetical protein